MTGDLSGMTYPGDLRITYQRDGNGQITDISADGTAMVRSVSYLPFGPVSGMTFGNGLGTVMTRDERYMPTRSVTGAAADYEYTRDAAGNVLSVSGTAVPSLPTGKTEYEHEGNRLTESTGNKEAVYSYDGHGNITSDGIRTFGYNQNNRLVSVSRDGTAVGEYSYDGQGRRVKKLASGIATLYHYDYAGNLIAETDGDGTPLRDYIYLNGEIIAMKVYGSQAGWYYFVNDHLGTPHKLVSASGEIVWAAAYLPFGEAQIITDTVVNNFRLPGQYYDAESGLHYNWHRYYDPKTGRYLTPDPIGQAGGINLYPYCSDNPVSLTDPDGQIAFIPIIAGAWAVIEFALSVSDAVSTAQTVADPCAGGFEKASSVGLFVLGMVAPGGGYSTASKKGTASIDELIKMMNKRAGVKAEYATGDALDYMNKIGAEGSHLLTEGGGSHILLRKDVATRRTALHEWLHRVLQKKTGGPRPGEDEIIEEFLEKHKNLFKID